MLPGPSLQFSLVCYLRCQWAAPVLSFLRPHCAHPLSLPRLLVLGEAFFVPPPLAFRALLYLFVPFPYPSGRARPAGTLSLGLLLRFFLLGCLLWWPNVVRCECYLVACDAAIPPLMIFLCVVFHTVCAYFASTSWCLTYDHVPFSLSAHSAELVRSVFVPRELFSFLERISMSTFDA